MWRGYGGNGSGVALVFDANKIPIREDTPFVMAKVDYATTIDRKKWVDNLIDKICNIINENKIPKEHASLCTYWYFERLKMFALTTKHSGFSEEKEWRVLYLPYRDPNGALNKYFDYWIGPTGIQPKLKLKLGEIQNFTEPGFSLSNILKHIILGPSLSSPLSQASALKMFDKIRPDLKDRVLVSRIPYRREG